MVVFSLESYESTPDQNGFTHWVFLDPLSRKKGHDSKLYTGRIKSSGWVADDRDGGLIKAFFPRDIEATWEWAQKYVRISKIVDRAAISFNREMGQIRNSAIETTRSSRKRVRFDPDCLYTFGQSSLGATTIRVQIPQIAELGSETVLDGSRHEGDYFIFEDKLSHSKMFICASESDSFYTSISFSRIIRLVISQEHYLYQDKNILQQYAHRRYEGEICERVVSDQTHRDCRRQENPYLEAFVHYFSNLYGGKVALDGLMGVYDEESGYTLTHPVIHSLDESFGPRDHGKYGICRVIQNHHCNSLCNYLPTMTLRFS